MGVNLLLGRIVARLSQLVRLRPLFPSSYTFLEKQGVNNNDIERLHGTIRERKSDARVRQQRTSFESFIYPYLLDYSWIVDGG